MLACLPAFGDLAGDLQQQQQQQRHCSGPSSASACGTSVRLPAQRLMLLGAACSPLAPQAQGGAGGSL
jgi:hypothetical protein